MFKYKTARWHDSEITRVEIERETSTNIWINGRRHKKHTAYEDYFDSWKKARASLRDRVDSKIQLAYDDLAYAQKEMAKLRKLKESDSF